MRKLIVLGLLASAVAVAAERRCRPAGRPPGQNGRIAFALFDPALDGTVTYTANPDGSHVEQLFSAAPSEGASLVAGRQRGRHPRPLHGRRRELRDDDRGSGHRDVPAAQDERSHPLHRLPSVVAGRQTTRLRGFGEPDSSRNGIYTIRSSDGGGLTRMTSNPGGEDMPGDYSPDGKRFVFARFDQDGDPVGLYVVKTDGSHLRPITPPGTIVSSAATGRRRERDRVRPPRERRHAQLAVGRSLRRKRAARDSAPSATWLRRTNLYPTSRGCIHPRWSPDGKKIIFSIFTETATGEVENVYTVNADGTGLTQITHGGAADGTPDWGTSLIP